MYIEDKETPRERISIFEDDDTPLDIPPRRRARNLRVQELQKIGEASGFQSRDPSVKPIDGRSMRATNRTKQMNMKVTPEVNQLLLEQVHAQGFPSVGAYVEHLLHKDIAES